MMPLNQSMGDFDFELLVLCLNLHCHPLLRERKRLKICSADFFFSFFLFFLCVLFCSRMRQIVKVRNTDGPHSD